MTVEEYKLLVPEHKDLEGDPLWNAMEDYMLKNDIALITEYKDAQGRDRLRFPWVPEDTGERVGTWDLVKHEELDSKKEWKSPTKQSAVFMIFDVSGKEPTKIIGDPIPIVETKDGLKVYKDGKEGK